VTYTVAIQGSSPPSATALPVSPTQVHLTGFAVSPPQVTRGHPVTLTWNATFATGFTVTTVSEPSLDFPWNAAQCQVTPMFATTTYVITAHGYTAGQSEPSRSVTVTVEKSKEKEKEKEHKDKEKEDLLEKQSKDIEPQILPGLSTGDSDAPDPGLPSGSQRAFIEPDERPDVGAHLRNDSSGA
jgi:hypothetical protein